MTFEKALEAMKMGFHVCRPFDGNNNMFFRIDGKGKIRLALYTEHETYKDLCEAILSNEDEHADDWKLYKPKMNKEESPMYTNLEITFKSGDTITYSKDEWDDYSYDGTSVCVKKNGAWVGIYNFDHVFSVELKCSSEDVI